MSKLRTWPDEKFLHEYEPAEMTRIVSVIIADFMAYINIVPTKDQRDYLMVRVITELKDKRYHFVKPCLIRYALDRYGDVRNNNLSAGVIIETIKMALQTDDYREIIKAWQEQQTNQLPEQSVTVMNREAMERAWQRCIESVERGDVNINNADWVLAYRYLGNVLKYRPEPSIYEKCQEEAVRIAQSEMRQESKELTVLGKRGDARSLINLLEDKAFGSGGRVTSIRRKLIAVEYIKSQTMAAKT